MNIEETLHNCQRGLAYYGEFAKFSHYLLDPGRKDSKECYDAWIALAKRLEKLCKEQSKTTVVVRGVDLELWTKWQPYTGRPLPRGFNDERSNIKRRPFAETAGDLWFHIKSDSRETCECIEKAIESHLGDMIESRRVTDGSERHGGRIFGGRFADPLINPVSRCDLATRVLIGEEDPEHRGGAFALSQKFEHDWNKLDAMSQPAKEDMIGRSESNVILPVDIEDRHIKCARQTDDQGINLRIIRQTLPYGRASVTGVEQGQQSSSQSQSQRGKEQGAHFTAYGRSPAVFETMLGAMIGEREGLVRDRLFSTTASLEGHYWYIPSAQELELGDGGELSEPRLPSYFDVRSANEYLHYNAKAMLHRIRQSPAVQATPLSDRIITLLGRQFSRWHEGWYRRRKMPALGHLRDYLEDGERSLLQASVALRKGKAIEISLSRVLREAKFHEQAGLFTLNSLELIVGNMPPITLGSGTQVMEYLDEDERIEQFFGNLDEYASTGHNIPDYSRLLEFGVGGYLDQVRRKLDGCLPEQHDFYQSVLWALQGLSKFVLHYAELAESEAASLSPGDATGRSSLEAIAQRMRHLSVESPRSFHEALQLIFITNCALHQIGEPMSIGRIDQVLAKWYQQDIDAGTLQPSGAQELLDAFWLKMDETVLLNRKHMNDYLNYGTGAVFYSAGNFPQGSAVNQWVQQVTVGGTVADDCSEGRDACNKLTLMCLRSAARLPLNAPCLSLRLRADTSKEIVAAAAEAILSGGAHPILFNDDAMIPALMGSGTLDLADARDYACDGCYEAIIPGKTEWAFSYVPLLPIVGMAMNQGTTIFGAGPIHLRGMKESWNSPPPEEIYSFEQFINIFFEHYRWALQKFFNSLSQGYGDLWKVCPGPLFSAFVSDCLEEGRDMTNGGAKYHIIAPMMCGIANTIDSLYAIKRLVFDEDSALCGLPELLTCLQCDWGKNMQEPWVNVLAGPERAAATAERYTFLRKAALALPKFGQGRSEEVKGLAERVVSTCVEMIHHGLRTPVPSVQQGLDQLKEKYSIKDKPFAFTLTPGVGTFEDNLGLGATMGASADGRAAGTPIADDFSPAPSPQDLPIDHAPRNVFRGLEDWNLTSIRRGISNAAPVDINIREDFPRETLERVISEFATGKIGSNMLTVTCGNPETFASACQNPEVYDLVRVRMGGWSEFFIAMFPEHQQHIMRRPLFVDDPCDENSDIRRNASRHTNHDEEAQS